MATWLLHNATWETARQAILTAERDYQEAAEIVRKSSAGLAHALHVGPRSPDVREVVVQISDTEILRVTDVGDTVAVVTVSKFERYDNAS